MTCSRCGKRLAKTEHEAGHCTDDDGCLGRAAERAMRGMVMRPGMAVPDVDVAYAKAPKLGDQ